MHTVTRQLITIVAEAVVERRLIDDLKACGARGYSVGHVSGEGVTGRHPRDYFERFAVVAWLSTVQVARGERF